MRNPRRAIRRWPVPLLVLLVLAGCGAAASGQGGAPPAQGAEGTAAPPPDSGPVVTESPRRLAPAETTPRRGGPREMLNLLGVDDSYFSQVFDGRPVIEDELEALWKFLYAVRRLKLLEIDGWTRRRWNLNDLVNLPVAHRGEFFHIEGRARRVRVERTVAEVAEQFEFQRYYACEITLGETDIPAIIYAHKVPKGWAPGEPLDERISAQALFLKLAGGESESATPVFIAQRVAWHRDTVLGRLKVDEGLFDDIVQRSPLRSSDHEAFYQVLAAMGRISSDELHQAAQAELARRKTKASGQNPPPDRVRVTDLFEDPAAEIGRIMEFEGTARRAIRVRVSEEDVVQRFGVREYFEIEVTVDLGGNYKLYKESDKIFTSYPVVFCVRELPSGMPEGNVINEHVRVAGSFFKIWAYQSEFAREESRGGRQLAPLLIGCQPVWYAHTSPVSDPVVGTITGLLFVAAIGGLWLIVWRWHRGDRKFRAATIARQLEEAKKKTLAQLGGSPKSENK